MNSRSKGRCGELELCKLLHPFWPNACPNLDQFSLNDETDAIGRSRGAYAPEVNQRRREAQLLGFDAYDQQDHGYSTPCWIYRKKPTAHGYAQMRMPNGSQPAAHRAFYEHYVGPIPDGLHLDHLCRVKRCVNPAHLEPVTNTENRRRSPSTKLTIDQAEEIRCRNRLGERQKDLAALFGVSKVTVSNICNGKRWAA